METTRRFTRDENEARYLFKQAEREHQRVSALGQEDSALRQSIARKLFKFGLVNWAEKLAPVEVINLNFEKAKKEFEEAKLARDLAAAFAIAAPERLKEKVIPEIEDKQEVIWVPKTTGLDLPQVHEEKIGFEDGEVYEGIPVERNEKYDWKQWDAFKEPKPVELEVKKPFVFFDEEVRTVGVFKTRERAGRVKSINAIEPMTNEDIADFVDDEARRLAKDGRITLRDDLNIVVKHLIDNPQVKPPMVRHYKGFGVGVDSKVYQLKRINPGKIPGVTFKNPNTNSLRVVFASDGNNIILGRIYTHTEAANKFGRGD